MFLAPDSLFRRGFQFWVSGAVEVYASHHHSGEPFFGRAVFITDNTPFNQSNAFILIITGGIFAVVRVTQWIIHAFSGSQYR
jgi:hypothetical protein